jgi:hypothetical protein
VLSSIQLIPQIHKRIQHLLTVIDTLENVVRLADAIDRRAK